MQVETLLRKLHWVTIRKYLVSSLISFVTGFAIVMVSQIDNLTVDSLKDGSLTGFLFLAFRAGFKAVVELFLASRK